jgi:hypothetical protein
MTFLKGFLICLTCVCYVLLYRTFRIDVMYAQSSSLNHHLAAFSPFLRVGVFLGLETLSPLKR